MRIEKSQKNTILLFIAILLLVNGCVSTVRTSRDPVTGNVTSFKVPANWDYRTAYRVPADKLKKIVDSYIGVRYKYGGMSRKGMDCSGFVLVVFKELNHSLPPRVSKDWTRVGRVISEQDARPGDLVLFNGGVFGGVNHVGIFMGNGQFAHASSSQGVSYGSTDGAFYRKHCAGLRRVF